MTIEGLLANWQDLHRLKMLERRRVFKSGFAHEARQATIRYLVRILELAAIERIVPYAGPIVTEK
jgi:hypothetical protein